MPSYALALLALCAFVAVAAVRTLEAGGAAPARDRAATLPSPPASVAGQEVAPDDEGPSGLALAPVPTGPPGPRPGPSDLGAELGARRLGPVPAPDDFPLPH